MIVMMMMIYRYSNNDLVYLDTYNVIYTYLYIHIFHLLSIIYYVVKFDMRASTAGVGTTSTKTISTTNYKNTSSAMKGHNKNTNIRNNEQINGRSVVAVPSPVVGFNNNSREVEDDDEEVPEELGTGSLVYDHSDLEGLWEYLDSNGKIGNGTSITSLTPTNNTTTNTRSSSSYNNMNNNNNGNNIILNNSKQSSHNVSSNSNKSSSNHNNNKSSSNHNHSILHNRLSSNNRRK